MNKELKKSVNDLVKNFIKEMHCWEIFCNEIDKSDLHYLEIEAKQREYVKNIFDKYCTQKDRKQGLPNCMSYGVNGSFRYNETEDIIKIEQENKNRILVITNGENEVDKYMYIVLLINGKWLIDNKKRKFFDEEDFRNTYL
ncbi:MAG: RhsIA family immunity protein [Helicobacteraceae bacterium]|nr:RhsIA family immunity protein [Helicobacteraceae bacterium]